MKRSYINNGRVFKAAAFVFALTLIFTVFMANAGAYMGLPRGNEGLENNIPENGNATPADTGKGNLGDTDGDGFVEDKGTDTNILDDIGDMGSDIVSDIGDMGSDIADMPGIGPHSNGAGTSAPTPADSGTAAADEGGSGAMIVVIIAIIAVIAIVVLLVMLLPKNRDKK